MTAAICVSVGNPLFCVGEAAAPLAAGTAGSLPISLAYSICSGVNVMAAAAGAAAGRGCRVAMCQTSSSSSSSRHDSSAERVRRLKPFMPRSGALDGEGVDVGVGLLGVEHLA